MTSKRRAVWIPNEHGPGSRDSSIARGQEARVRRDGTSIRLAMRISTLAGIASLVLACASRNHVATDRPPATTTSANTAVTMASGRASTPLATNVTTPATSSDAQTEALDQSLIKRGYRPRRIKGQLRYCQAQTLTGTHFDNTVCLTSAEIKANDEKTRRDLDTVNRLPGTKCPNNNCG
jgi:hypothetical protein